MHTINLENCLLYSSSIISQFLDFIHGMVFKSYFLLRDNKHTLHVQCTWCKPSWVATSYKQSPTAVLTFCMAAHVRFDSNNQLHWERMTHNSMNWWTSGPLCLTLFSPLNLDFGLWWRACHPHSISVTVFCMFMKINLETETNTTTKQRSRPPGSPVCLSRQGHDTRKR